MGCTYKYTKGLAKKRKTTVLYILLNLGNKTIDLNLKIKEYANIPYFPNNNYWEGELCEEIYRELLLNVEDDIRTTAYFFTTYGLTLNDKINNTQKISVYDIMKSDIDNSYISKYVRIQLEKNNETIDTIYLSQFKEELSSFEKINGSNGIIQYERELLEGCFLSVIDYDIGIQKYKIILYWRITYPTYGYENERIVGEIEFET